MASFPAKDEKEMSFIKVYFSRFMKFVIAKAIDIKWEVGQKDNSQNVRQKLLQVITAITVKVKNTEKICSLYSICSHRLQATFLANIKANVLPYRYIKIIKSKQHEETVNDLSYSVT